MRPTLAARLAFVLALAGAGAPAARAQSLNALGVQRLNQDAQTLWSQDGLPMAREQASVQLQKLVGVPHPVNDKTTATITKVNSITLSCPVAPGCLELNGQRLRFAAPLTGAWTIGASVDVRVKGKILGIKVDRTYTVEVEVRDLRASAQVDFDSSDPSAPKVKHVYPAQVDFTLKVKTSSWVMNALLWLTKGTVNGVADVAAKVGAAYLAQKLNVVAPTVPQVIGAGAPALARIPINAAKLEDAAFRLTDQIEQYRRPYGPTCEMHFDKPYHGTWEESLADPQFDPGTPNGFHSWGDSGEMTGIYLSSLAYRWQVTRDRMALALGTNVLGTMRTLLTMRGEPGNMNRSILPLRAKPDAIKPGPWKPGDNYVLPWNGEDHVFSDYMSRDEYFGAFTGLVTAYDFFPDGPMRVSASESLQMALDYLLRNNWTWRNRNGGFGERWQGSLEQQYAWILCGSRVNPAKYQAVREQYKGFADLIWTGVWISCADPFYSYYKFQLSSGTMDTLLRLETNPVLWQRAYQAIAIQRHYIGHHLNAYFDVVYLAHDPSSRAALGAEATNLLARLLKMPRRRTRVDISQDPTIEKADYTLSMNANLLFPGDSTPQTVKISKYPLPPDRRIVDGYVWSACPLKLKQNYPSNPDPYIEGESLDFVTPYWMGRYYGVIPAPRKVAVTAQPATVSPRRGR